MMDAITVALTVGFVLGTLGGCFATWMVQNATNGPGNYNYQQGYEDGSKDFADLVTGRRPQTITLERMPRPTIAPPITVRRVTVQDGMTVEERHLLPADVARRLGYIEGGQR